MVAVWSPRPPQRGDGGHTARGRAVRSGRSGRRKVAAVGAADNCYDLAGNLTVDATSRTFTYDAENRQTSLTTPGQGTVSYAYDGEGRRVKKIEGGQETVYVYNVLGQLVAEYSQQGPQGTGGTLFLTSDHLGSTRVVTDQGKAIKGRHDYLPFGEEIPASLGRSAIAGYGGTGGLRHKFTAKERDTESNLDYFGFRYYSGAQGRFTSADDIYNDTDVADPASWNRYAYVRNNPLAAVDPDGTAAVKVKDFSAQLWGLNQPRRSDVSYFKSYVANLAVAAIGGIELSIGLATGNVPNLVPESVRNAADGNSQAKFDVNVGFGIAGLANAVTVGAKAPSFVVSEGGDAIVVPEGASGPVPVINTQGKTTGFAFTGGKGGRGLDPRVAGVRIMDATCRQPQRICGLSKCRQANTTRCQPSNRANVARLRSLASHSSESTPAATSAATT